MAPHIKSCQLRGTRICEKQGFTVRELCDRNSPCHLTRPIKTLQQQWNLGRNLSLSPRHLTHITVADVALLDYTVLLRSTHMPTVMKDSCRYTKQLHFTLHLVGAFVRIMVERINFEHDWPQQETADCGWVTATYSNKKDLLYIQGLWYRSKYVLVFLFSNLLLNQTKLFDLCFTAAANFIFY